MADLLYQNKISLASPMGQYEPKVVRFEAGDGYSVRGVRGLNPVIERWTITWVGLTAAEARALSNQLISAAINVVTYTPDPYNDARGFTCESHGTEPVLSGREAYNITATLRREYDILS